MNRKLRTALMVVAFVSIAIALYYPVAQFLDEKALDDEMLALRRLKAEAAADASTSPGQTGQDAYPDGAAAETADQGIKPAGAAANTTNQGAKPDGETARKADQGIEAAGEIITEADQGTETSKACGGASDRSSEVGGPNDGQAGHTAESDDASVSRMLESDEATRDTTDRMAAPNAASGVVTDPSPAATVAEATDSAPEQTISIDSSDPNGQSRANPNPDRNLGGVMGTQADGSLSRLAQPGAADTLTIHGNAPGVSATPAPTATSTPAPTPFVFDEGRILPDYKPLYEQNRDMVGWLKIDGTMVDYPVLKRADEEFYLTRDFYGKNNSNGQLILDAQCDPFTPDMNLVISGHDMKSGKMFGTLQKFASERFGRQHPIIEFDTLFWRAKYRLVAAFYAWDYLKREDGFRYNVDIRFRLELKKYLEELDQIKLYDTGVPVEFGDQLITLSTCSTRTEEGRFVVVARRLREDEQP